jgi:hypothetical protein
MRANDFGGLWCLLLRDLRREASWYFIVCIIAIFLNAGSWKSLIECLCFGPVQFVMCIKTSVVQFS